MRIRLIGVFFLLLPVVLGLPVWASSALRLDFDRLVMESDRVVEATLTGRTSEWASDNRRIYTTFNFETGEDIAGTGPGTFEVVQPGGQVGRWAQIAHGYPTFQKGDRVILFLEEVPQGYRVVGMSQGVFGFYQDEKNDAIHQKIEGLHFPGDRGQPIVIDRVEAYRRIRELFAARRAP